MIVSNEAGAVGGRRRRAVTRDRVLDVVYPLVALALLLLAWELWVRVGNEPRYIMVPFSDVMEACWSNAGVLLHHTWVTLKESLYGFALGTGIGIGLAFALVSVRTVSKSLYPLIVVYHVIPVIAVAPLLTIWFGFGLLPKILIVANFTFFPIMLNTMIGLRATQTVERHLFRSIGANWLQSFWRLRLPNALPQAFVGLKIASTLAVIGAVVAEYVSASEGLGYYVLDANGKLDTRQLTSGVVYLSIAGVVFFGAVELVDRLATPWHVSHRTERPARPK
jgi:NitT/TauT family transport system permease protein